jgi:hypothetical protein
VEKGKYTGRRVDFSRYATVCFNPFLFSPATHATSGCGASALGLLTGKTPTCFLPRNGVKHYSDAYMLRCLRRHGFRVVRLTQCNLTQATNGVTARHVLLISQLIRKNEATWLVHFNSICYHNFDAYTLESLSFINKPLLSAYVLSHPKWPRDFSAPAKPVPKTSRGGVSWEFLRKAGLPIPKRKRAP